MWCGSSVSYAFEECGEAGAFPPEAQTSSRNHGVDPSEIKMRGTYSQIKEMEISIRCREVFHPSVHLDNERAYKSNMRRKWYPEDRVAAHVSGEEWARRTVTTASASLLWAGFWGEVTVISGSISR